MANTKPLSVEKNGTIFTINVSKVFVWWSLAGIFTTIVFIAAGVIVWVVGVQNYRETSTQMIESNLQKVIEINYNMREILPDEYEWKDYNYIADKLKFGKTN